MRPTLLPAAPLRALLVALLVLLGSLASTAPAQAAKAASSNRPAVTVVAEVDGADATVTFTVNRAVRQIKTLACTLNGLPTPCGSVTVETSKATTYAATHVGLAARVHAVTVSVSLTDGGVATATASFEVDASEPEPERASGEAACARIPGVYSTAGFGMQWTCTYYNHRGADPEPELVAACPTPSSLLGTSLDGAEAVMHACPRPDLAAAEESCSSVGQFHLNVDGSFTCGYRIAAVGPDFASGLIGRCDALDGVVSVDAKFDARMFWCSAPEAA